MTKQEMIEQVGKKIKLCSLCKHCKTRDNAVPGGENVNAKIMFIGEAPGQEEDKHGIPFVGRAGDIFNELLKSVNLERKDIFVTNILKCRPLKNADPTEEDIRACTPYLEAQIEIISPTIICCLGNFATAFIMKKYGLEKEIKGITQIKGKAFEVLIGGKVMHIIPLFHPAVALYSPSKITELKQDMRIFKK